MSEFGRQQFDLGIRRVSDFRIQQVMVTGSDSQLFVRVIVTPTNPKPGARGLVPLFGRRRERDDAHLVRLHSERAPAGQDRAVLFLVRGGVLFIGHAPIAQIVGSQVHDKGLPLRGQAPEFVGSDEGGVLRNSLHPASLLVRQGRALPPNLGTP